MSVSNLRKKLSDSLNSELTYAYGVINSILFALFRETSNIETGANAEFFEQIPMLQSWFGPYFSSNGLECINKYFFKSDKSKLYKIPKEWLISLIFDRCNEVPYRSLVFYECTDVFSNSSLSGHSLANDRSAFFKLLSLVPKPEYQSRKRKIDATDSLQLSMVFKTITFFQLELNSFINVCVMRIMVSLAMFLKVNNLTTTELRDVLIKTSWSFISEDDINLAVRLQRLFTSFRVLVDENICGLPILGSMRHLSVQHLLKMSEIEDITKLKAYANWLLKDNIAVEEFDDAVMYHGASLNACSSLSDNYSGESSVYWNLSTQENYWTTGSITQNELAIGLVRKVLEMNHH